MSTETVNQFLSIVKEYRDEKLSKEEALNHLEKEFSSAQKKNRNKIMKVLDKNKFYEYVRYTADELISIPPRFPPGNLTY